MKPPAWREPPDTPEDGAAHWFVREQAGALTPEERERRDGWLREDAAHRQAHEQASALWAELDRLAGHEQMRILRREALQAKPAVRRPPPHRVMAAAACLAAVMVAVYWFRTAVPGSAGPGATQSLAEMDSTVHRTAVGERSTVTLKDGSVVTLNTASEMRVRFTASERTLELTRGQAYFSVAPDKQHPFVVVAGGQRITALGTAFDVRIERDGLQVVLVEGKIAVNPIGVSADRIELEPGERFVSSGATPGSVSVADPGLSTSWRSGRIVFADTSVADAVAEINRYRSDPIVIGDAAIGALRISGTYRVSEVDRFPQVLSAYYPVELSVRPSGKTILLWRKDEAAP